MIKEAKNVDFYTSGRQPSEEDFARISEWIKKDKQKRRTHKHSSQAEGKNYLAKHGIAKSGADE
jgi:hypothetical protein